jgi:DNA-binding MarR family transcriptional regulator
VCGSKNDYKILFMLYEDNCITPMRSYPLKKIAEKTQLSDNKIRMALKTFKMLGYIEEGLVQHNAKTYFVTQYGIQKLKEL